MAGGKGWAQGQGRLGSACGEPGVPGTVPTPWVNDTGRGQRHWERACHSAGFIAIQVQEGPPIRQWLPWKREFFLTAPGRRGHSTPWGKGHTGKLQGQWRAAQIHAQEPLLWFPWEGTGKAESAGSGWAGLDHFRALGHRSCLWLSG